MALTPPKRLFHIPSMSTVMYVDVADNVTSKGYAAVSHVWGNQKLYSADELGIDGGVSWEIPLSNPNKICRLVNAMNHHKMEYCWWDILCMPQDKQNEINLEIPLMGDYYSGADITFVLSDQEYTITDEYKTWCSMMSNIVESGRDITKEEDLYMCGKGSELANFSVDPWVERVWTFQETALSRKIILSSLNGDYINLTQMFGIARWILGGNMKYGLSFRNSLPILAAFGSFTINRKLHGLDLVDVLSGSCTRCCHKTHDRFYGVFGILGYKDFLVDYDIEMDDLNKKVAQYAYSKGDISWIAISGSTGTGFLQPMYEKFQAESGWKAVRPSAGLITIEDGYLHMKMLEFGEISRYERYNFTDKLDCEEIRRIIRLSMHWGFSNLDVVVAMGKYNPDGKYMGEAMLFFDQFVAGVSVLEISKFLSPSNSGNLPFTSRDLSHIRGRTLSLLELICLNLSADASVHIIEIVGTSGDKHLVIVYGNVDIGDRIMVPVMRDTLDRRLGIVVSKLGKRKSICYLTPKAISKCDLRLVSFGFPL